MTRIRKAAGFPRGRWFKVGDRVVMTRAAQRMGLQGRAKSPRGRVVVVTSRLGIKVLRDGLKRPDGYHSGLWRRIDAWSRVSRLPEESPTGENRE